MEKKENGEFISPPEMGDKPENMKGYIPPDILIPQLQNEIQSTKNTLKNIDNLDNFFKKKKSNLELFFSPEENKSKIRIKKNLSSIKRLNNKNNNINDSTDLSLINHLSPVSPNSSYKLNNSNDNSPTSSDKSTLFIFSKLPSNNRRKNRFSAISDLYNQKNKRKTNLPDINFVLRNIRGRVSNVNIHNNIRSSLQNNSADAKSKIMSKNFLRLKNFSKNERIEEKNISDESEKSELELINQLNYNPKNESKRTLNLKLDLSDNNNDIFNEKEKRPIKIKRLPFKMLKEDENLIKTEKIFNLVLKDKTLDYNREKIIEYLKERGYNTSRNINNKELYLNFDKVEKGVQRNIFQDELKIRGDFANTKYKNLLEKNNILSKQLEDNTLKYKKMICEKNMDKIDV